MSRTGKSPNARLLIDLDVKPKIQDNDNIIGKPLGPHRGMVIPGFSKYTFQLSADDELSFIANTPDTHALQIQLTTKNPQIIQNLPSKRANSLVQSTIHELNKYYYRHKQYEKTKTKNKAQQQKLKLALDTIKQLKSLLGRERSLQASDIKGQELLRKDIILLIETARAKNRQISRSILVSEGSFNQIFYTAANEHVQDYHFNQAITISKQDQLNFDPQNTESQQITNPALHQLFVAINLSNTDRKRLNDYFSTQHALPPFNEDAIKHLLKSIEPCKSSASLLCQRIKSNYDKIINDHEIKPVTNCDKTIVWDSNFHLGNQPQDIDRLLIALCDCYHMKMPYQLKHLKASRVAHFIDYIQGLWRNFQYFADYLALKHKPKQTIETRYSKDLKYTTVKPFYKFKGTEQHSFETMEQMVDFIKEPLFYAQASHYQCSTPQKAQEILNRSDETQVILIREQQLIIIKENDQFKKYYYAKQGENFIPLPSGTDLYQIANINYSPVHLINRIRLNFWNYTTRLVYFFRDQLKGLFSFLRHELPRQLSQYYYDGHIRNKSIRKLLGHTSRDRANKINQFINSLDINEIMNLQPNDYLLLIEENYTNNLDTIIFNHLFSENETLSNEKKRLLKSASKSLIIQQLQVLNALKNKQQIIQLKKIIKNQQQLSDKTYFKQFIEDMVKQQNLVAAIPEHKPNQFEFNNPLHHAFRFIWHIGQFFVHYSERNPVIGTLAATAYVYGAMAILTPQLLTTLLSKLHLSLLIKAIKPTQDFAKLISNGLTSEAITAAMTYWQAAVTLGQWDKIIEHIITTVKENPAELTAVSLFIMGLGYAMCQTIPFFRHEMGPYPYINYATLGAKGGATLYDMTLNPGNDIILGSIKWLVNQIAFVTYFFVGPFLEWYSYGFRGGFLLSINKNLTTALTKLKQAAVALACLSIAFSQFAINSAVSLLVHVPFKGITKAATKLLSTLLDLKNVGDTFIAYSIKDDNWNFFSSFRISPLYYFSNPFIFKHKSLLVQTLINLPFLITIPVLEVIKNVIILPTIDVISLSTRLLFTVVLNPASKFLCLLTGVLLSLIGSIIKVSFAKPLDKANEKIVDISEKVDLKYLEIRQVVFSFLNWLQQKLKLWAYSDEILKVNVEETPLRKLSALEKANQNDSSVFSTLLKSSALEEEQSPHQLDETSSPIVKAPGRLGFFAPSSTTSQTEYPHLKYA